MTVTNIKGLPEGKYWTEYGYSQSYPWVEVKRTAKTVTLAPVNIKKDIHWQPEIIPGWFCGHCTNQHEQTWVYGGVSEGHTKVIRLTKKGWTHRGTKFVQDVAKYFYDYNF